MTMTTPLEACLPAARRGVCAILQRQKLSPHRLEFWPGGILTAFWVVSFLGGGLGATAGEGPAASRRIEMVCHRGANDRAPENTMAAYERAITLGAEWIEIDVRTSKDGVFYVMHDLAVDRTTNGKGLFSELTSDQIDRLDAGVRFSPEFRGQRIPKVREVLLWLHGKGGANLDIKDADPTALIRLIDETRMRDRVFLWFGNPFDAARFRRFDKRIPIKVNTSLAWQMDEGKRLFGASLVEIDLHGATPGLLRHARQLDLKIVLAYGGSDPAVFRRILGMDVDMVMLDHPEVFANVRRQPAR